MTKRYIYNLKIFRYAWQKIWSEYDLIWKVKMKQKILKKQIHQYICDFKRNPYLQFMTRNTKIWYDFTFMTEIITKIMINCSEKFPN